MAWRLHVLGGTRRLALKSEHPSGKAGRIEVNNALSLGVGLAKRAGVAALALVATAAVTAFTAPSAHAPIYVVASWEADAYIEAAQERHDADVDTPSAVEFLRRAGFDGEGIIKDLLLAGVPASSMHVTLSEEVELASHEAQDRLCMAQAIYYEARNQDALGRLAVADVVLNRVADKRFPNTICGVVFQGAKKGRGCQFSFACDGSMKKARENRSWEQAEALADLIFRGFRPPLTRFATFYHADYVDPYWAKVFDETTVIGDHIFYRPAGALKIAANQLGIELEPAQS
ncbi:MAG: cell wall hydrolase [Pseudomonadota bacterium]